MANAELTLEVDLGPLRQLLEEIRDRLPARAEKPAAPLKGSGLAHAKREALVAVLDALDGWIEGAQEDHEASGHRGENRGEECWRQFAAQDIRSMVNDVARELGLTEFPAPKTPKEDTL